MPAAIFETLAQALVPVGIMQDALWEVAPEAGVVASAGVVGGSLLKVFDAFGAAAAGVSGAAVGAVSATAGALAAKAFSDRNERQAIEKRLLEVKRHAPQSSPLSLQPLLAVRQMFEAVDWCLAHDEKHWTRQGPASMAFSCISGDRGLGSKHSEASADKDYRKHLKKVRGLCSPTPLRGQAGRRPTARGNGVKKTGAGESGVISGLSVPGSSQAYERLFNPQWGTVRSKQGVCAALAYLVSQFLELRHCPKGSLFDGDRNSLRMAVTSLSRHSVFDEEEKAAHTLKVTRLLRPNAASAEPDEVEEEEQKRWKTQPDQEQEKLRSKWTIFTSCVFRKFLKNVVSLGLIKVPLRSGSFALPARCSTGLATIRSVGVDGPGRRCRGRGAGP